MPRGRSLAVTHTGRSETARRLPPAGCRAPARALFCRHDAQRLGGARRSDGHASTAAGMPDVKERSMLGDTFDRRKFSRPCGWLRTLLDDLSGQDEGSNRAFWRSCLAGSGLSLQDIAPTPTNR